MIAAAKALGFRPNDATDDSEREAQHVESPALVTGANKGIGHEVARQLGSMGFHVLVGARNSENGQRTTEALRKTGATATFISLDVSDPESIGKAGQTGLTSQRSRRHMHLAALNARLENAPLAYRAILIRNFRKRACTIGRDLPENEDCAVKRQSPMQRMPRWRNCGWPWRPRPIDAVISGLPSCAPCSWGWNAGWWPSNFAAAIEWFGSG